MIERNNNTNVALEKLFEEFYSMVVNAKHVPFTEKVMLDEDEVMNLIEDLKNAIPREIKSATQVLEEQKNIVNKAYADADRIVEQAKNEAERIVSVAKADADAKIQQEEIVKQANAVAEEIKADSLRYQEETKAAADAYALRMKQDALEYVDDMMSFLSENLKSALHSLDENRDNVAKEMRTVMHGDVVEITGEQED